MVTYLDSLRKIAAAYEKPGGSEGLVQRMHNGEFQDGLNDTQYDVLTSEVCWFLRTINTTGSNRRFGFDAFDIGRLALHCEEHERAFRTFHPQSGRLLPFYQ